MPDGMRNGVQIGDEFYFTAYDFKQRLLVWRTDGTTATLIASPRVFRPSFTEFEGSVYFNARVCGAATALRPERFASRRSHPMPAL